MVVVDGEKVVLEIVAVVVVPGVVGHGLDFTSILQDALQYAT